MDWLAESFSASLALTWWQQFGLAFLLGSFTVATWSDLKYLSAQREFREVWLLFLFGVMLFELHDLQAGTLAFEKLAIKWGLIALLSLLSLDRVGVLFRLASGDVAALAAAASLLTPTPILLLFAIAKALAWLMQRVLWPQRSHWPFMPVVSLATLAVLCLGLMW